MTCVECGAEMGTSKLCQRCGASAVVRTESAPSTQTASKMASNRAGAWIGGIVVAIVNVGALWGAISGLAIYATQGTPAEIGQGYEPLGAAIFIAASLGSIPVLTAVLLIRGFTRRAKERRALASDAPVPLAETSD